MNPWSHRVLRRHVFTVASLALTLGLHAQPVRSSERHAFLETSLGPAFPVENHVLEGRKFDPDIAIRASVGVESERRLSFAFSVARTELLSRGDTYYRQPFSGDVIRQGPSEKTVWLIGPRVRYRALTLPDERSSLRLWAGPSYQRTISRLYGDENLDDPDAYVSRPRVEGNDALTLLLGGGLDLKLTTELSLTLDWEMTFGRTEAPTADRISYLQLGLARRFF